MRYEDGNAFCSDNTHVVTGSGGFQLFMRKPPDNEASSVGSMKEYLSIGFKSAGH